MRCGIGPSTVCVALLLGLHAPAAVSAATFAVGSGTDGADVAPGDGVCATGAGTCTLRAAVEEANALPGSDTVTLQALKHTITGAALSITGDIVVTGPGAALCTIKGKKGTRLFRQDLRLAIEREGHGGLVATDPRDQFLVGLLAPPCQMPG